MERITVTLNTKTRKSTSLVYDPPAGIVGSVKMPKSMFPKGTVPTSVIVESDAFAKVKAKMTPEERKAARKNAPKLSAAEKLAKLNERAEKLRLKIAADAAKTAPATSEPAADAQANG